MCLACEQGFLNWARERGRKRVAPILVAEALSGNRCVQTVGKETAGHINPAMSSASANIDLASLALGDVVTTGKGAKQIPLSTSGGEAVVWRPKDALTVLFEPSAFNQPDATRVNLCLSVTPAVVSSLQDFDECCV